MKQLFLKTPFRIAGNNSGQVSISVPLFTPAIIMNNSEAIFELLTGWIRDHVIAKRWIDLVLPEVEEFSECSDEGELWKVGHYFIGTGGNDKDELVWLEVVLSHDDYKEVNTLKLQQEFVVLVMVNGNVGDGEVILNPDRNSVVFQLSYW